MVVARQRLGRALLTQEISGVEVDADVAGAVGELARVVAQLLERVRHVRVLHHGEAAALAAQHAHLLFGCHLPAHLGAHIGAVGDAVAREHGVGHAANGVVDREGVHELDARRVHVCHRARQVQSAVDATVAIGRLGDLGGGLQHDLAVRGEARQRALLEEEHAFVAAQAEVLLGSKERPRVRIRHRRRHHVQRQAHLLDGLAGALRGQRAHAQDAVGLQAEQRLPRRQRQVVLSLGLSEAQSSALAPRQHERGQLAARHGIESSAAPRVHVARIGIGQLGQRRSGQRLQLRRRLLRRHGQAALIRRHGLGEDGIDVIEVKRFQLRHKRGQRRVIRAHHAVVDEPEHVALARRLITGAKLRRNAAFCCHRAALGE
mmetsp:Transcript_144637/g.351221  ORF Transcript_144637/g.351221 Transcript_144637/m.351221 type:complete len:375 (-) Transcript_144637:35-1159(-)